MLINFFRWCTCKWYWHCIADCYYTFILSLILFLSNYLHDILPPILPYLIIFILILVSPSPPYPTLHYFVCLDTLVYCIPLPPPVSFYLILLLLLMVQNLLEASREELSNTTESSRLKLLQLSALLDKEKTACVDASKRCAQLNVMAQALTMTVSEKDALLKR